MADELSKVFAALADPTRRDMVARLAVSDATVSQLAEPYDVSIQAVSKHLKVLQDAGLGRISDEKRQSLQHTYDAFDHPAANEILRWLAGEYQVTDEMVATQ